MPGVVMETSVLAIAIFGTTVTGVVGYGKLRDIRSRRRLAARQCVRCGLRTDVPIDLTPADLHPKVALLMCARCARRTRRNHRIAYRTYLALCGALLVIAVFAIVRDLRGGVHHSLRYYWRDTVVALLPFFGLLPKFRQGLVKEHY